MGHPMTSHNVYYVIQGKAAACTWPVHSLAAPDRASRGSCGTPTAIHTRHGPLAVCRCHATGTVPAAISIPNRGGWRPRKLDVAAPALVEGAHPDNCLASTSNLRPPTRPWLLARPSRQVRLPRELHECNLPATAASGSANRDGSPGTRPARGSEPVKSAVLHGGQPCRFQQIAGAPAAAAQPGLRSGIGPQSGPLSRHPHSTKVRAGEICGCWWRTALQISADCQDAGRRILDDSRHPTWNRAGVAEIHGSSWRTALQISADC